MSEASLNPRLELALMAVQQLPAKDRVNLLRRLQPGADQAAPEMRIVRRSEAARMLGMTVRGIDNLAREGNLHRVRLPGRKRGAGFRLDELRAMISGGRSDT